MGSSVAISSSRWQYFSKYHLKWVDAKLGDRIESLEKLHYKIRDSATKEDLEGHPKCKCKRCAEWWGAEGLKAQ